MKKIVFFILISIFGFLINFSAFGFNGVHCPEVPNYVNHDPVIRLADGTGFIVSPQGHILTALHVIDEQIDPNNPTKTKELNFRIRNETDCNGFPVVDDSYVGMVFDIIEIGTLADDGSELNMDFVLLKPNTVTSIAYGEIIDVADIQQFGWLSLKRTPLNLEVNDTLYFVGNPGQTCEAENAWGKQYGVGQIAEFRDGTQQSRYAGLDTICRKGFSGGPVYDTHGEIVGIAVKQSDTDDETQCGNGPWILLNSSFINEIEYFLKPTEPEIFINGNPIDHNYIENGISLSDRIMIEAFSKDDYGIKKFSFKILHNDNYYPIEEVVFPDNEVQKISEAIVLWDTVAEFYGNNVDLVVEVTDNEDNLISTTIPVTIINDEPNYDTVYNCWNVYSESRLSDDPTSETSRVSESFLGDGECYNCYIEHIMADYLNYDYSDVFFKIGSISNFWDEELENFFSTTTGEFSWSYNYYYNGVNYYEENTDEGDWLFIFEDDLWKFYGNQLEYPPKGISNIILFSDPNNDWIPEENKEVFTLSDRSLKVSMYLTNMKNGDSFRIEWISPTGEIWNNTEDVDQSMNSIPDCAVFSHFIEYGWEIEGYENFWTENQGKWEIKVYVNDFYIESIFFVMSISNEPPTVNIKNPNKGDIFSLREIIDFESIANDPDGNIVSFYWDFGDGSFSTIQNPFYSYEDNEGTYEVKLTVIDDTGLTAFDKKKIKIVRNEMYPLSTNIVYPPNNTEFILKDIIDFKSTVSDSNGIIKSYYWDFGDGSFSNFPNPYYSYNENTGTYIVTLIVTDEGGYTATDSIKLIVSTEDSDNDGIVDNIDAFPNDASASLDTDGDGYPDSWNVGYSQTDSTTGLTLDEYPDDASKWDVSIPEAPQITTTTSGINVTATWTSVPDATGYRLYFAPNPYTVPESIQHVDMGANTNISVNLWPGASYFVAVTAYNEAGESGYSNIELFTIPFQ